MKQPSIYILLILIVISGVGAFAHKNGHSFWTSPKQHFTNKQLSIRGGAQTQMARKNAARKRLAFRYASFSEVHASATRGDSSDENSTLVQSISSAPLTKSIFSSAIFVFMDLCIKKLFKETGISFPSSVAGLCALTITLLVSPFHKSLYRILSPGAKLMQKFMMIFLVPNLIVLPLCEGSFSAYEMAKLSTIIIGGFLFSLLSTCCSVSAVSRLFRRAINEASEEATTTDKAIVSSHSNTAPPKAFSDEITYKTRAIMALSGLSAVVSSSVESNLTTPLLALSMLAATIHNFAFGARQPKKLTKVVHPLVSCTTLSWVWAYILGLATGGSLTSMLQGYRIGGTLSMGSSGAGDFLTFVLGPAVVSLGTSIYERRALIRQNFKEVVAATFVSVVGGLYGTAFMVRLLGLESAELRLAMLPRNITSALAVAIAEIVGANRSLAAAIAVVTGLIGANFGASLLDLFRIKDPVTRGLGIGSAAHGLGTAAFVDENDAFPFAAISMALTAICGTVFVSVPSVKALAIRIALGIAD